MTYGYGDAPGGWPPPETDPPAPGRRRAPDPDERPEADGGRYDDPERTFQAPPPPPVYDPPAYGRTGREPTVYGRHAVGRATPPGFQPPGPQPPGPQPPARDGAPAPQQGGIPPYGRPAPDQRPPHDQRPPYEQRPPLDARPPQDQRPAEYRQVDQPPAQRVHRPPADEGALTDRYVPRRGAVYPSSHASGFAPPPPPPPLPPPPPAQPAPHAPTSPPGPAGRSGLSAGQFPAGQFAANPAATRPGQMGRPDQFGRPEPHPAADPFVPPRQFAPEREFAPDRQFAPPDRRPPAEVEPDRGRRLPATLWKSILGGVVVVALLVIVGVGAFSLVNRGSAGASGPSAPPKHDISSQAVDPAPLTVAEVFPGPTVGATATDAGYQVVKTDLSADCKVVAVGDLVTTFASDGCTQAVRATLTSADKAFVITTGLLNLRDQAGATSAEDAVKASVGGGKGRFTGLAGGGTTDVITKVATQLGWDSRGHFLAYAVIARADGSTIAATDPTATKIINALVEDYLKGTVLQARVDARPASGASAGTGSAKPSPSKK